MEPEGGSGYGSGPTKSITKYLSSSYQYLTSLSWTKLQELRACLRVYKVSKCHFTPGAKAGSGAGARARSRNRSQPKKDRLRNTGNFTKVASLTICCWQWAFLWLHPTRSNLGIASKKFTLKTVIVPNGRCLKIGLSWQICCQGWQGGSCGSGDCKGWGLRRPFLESCSQWVIFPEPGPPEAQLYISKYCTVIQIPSCTTHVPVL